MGMKGMHDIPSAGDTIGTVGNERRSISPTNGSALYLELARLAAERQRLQRALSMWERKAEGVARRLQDLDAQMTTILDSPLLREELGQRGNCPALGLEKGRSEIILEY